MTSTFDLKKKLTEIIPDLHEGGFIAYCGAGISIPAPTCAPSWWTLTEEILASFFERTAKDDLVTGLPTDLIMKNQSFQPEAIFEVFGNIFIDNFIGGTSQALDDGINNTWFDKNTNEGNYWSDWLGVGNYTIDGEANSEDPYPLSSPPIIIIKLNCFVFVLKNVHLILKKS